MRVLLINPKLRLPIDTRTTPHLGLAYLGSIWLFYVLGGLMFLGVGFRFAANGLAAELRRDLAGLELPPSEEIPLPLFCHLVDKVRGRFENVTSPKLIASTVQQVWDGIHSKPPGVIATLALLLVYVGAIAATLVVPVVLMALFRWGPAAGG